MFVITDLCLDCTSVIVELCSNSYLCGNREFIPSAVGLVARLFNSGDLSRYDNSAIYIFEMIPVKIV